MDISKSDFQLEIINRVKSLRLKAGVGQAKLAGILNVVTGQIGNIESPKFKHKYTLKQLYTISNYFGVSFDYILTGENKSLTTNELINLLINYDE